MTTVLAGPTRAESAAKARPDTVIDVLQHEVDRLFDSFSRGVARTTSRGLPAMDISETDQEIEITAELPGLEDADVQISMDGDVLSIRGEKKSEHEQKGKNFRMVERSFGSFSRSVTLPPGIDPNSIKAVMAKGVLRITAPKPAGRAATCIAVQSAT